MAVYLLAKGGMVRPRPWMRQRSKKVESMNLRDYQRAGEGFWYLPSWTHPVGQGVMPFFVELDRRLFPVGTAFVVGRFGLVASAAHCIYQALRERGIEVRPGHRDITSLGFRVLHYRPAEGEVRFTLWPLEHIQIALPTDVLFASLVWNAGIQTMNFAISPSLPRVGKKVLTLGYVDFRFPDGGIPLGDVAAGRFDWNANYSHRLGVSEGTVQSIFLRRFMRGYLDGPCFLTSAATRHGQSGGPVFNEAGDVCATHSADATLFSSEPSALASPLYAALPVEIKTTARLGKVFSMTYAASLLQLIDQGIVRSDGTEALADIVQEGVSYRVNPRVHLDDCGRVYEDFHAYTRDDPATPQQDGGSTG